MQQQGAATMPTVPVAKPSPLLVSTSGQLLDNSHTASIVQAGSVPPAKKAAPVDRGDILETDVRVQEDRLAELLKARKSLRAKGQ